MTHIPLDSLYHQEIIEYGHVMVGMIQRLVLRQLMVPGVTEFEEIQIMSRRLLSDPVIRRNIQIKIDAMPEDSNPWRFEDGSELHRVQTEIAHQHCGDS